MITKSRFLPDWLFAGGLGAALLFFSQASFAQPGPGSSSQPGSTSEPASAPIPEVPKIDESPRASLENFLLLCERENYGRAAGYLDLSVYRGNIPPGELAQQLCEILEKYPDKVKVELLSSAPEGVTTDNLPPDEEEILLLPGMDEKPERILFVRRTVPEGLRWHFAPHTVARIDVLHQPLRAPTPAASTSAPAEVKEKKDEKGNAPTTINPSSPRGSLGQYLDLARAGKFEEAARYLNLPEDRIVEGPVLARRLKAVLDRHLWIDMTKISDVPEGRTEDGYPRHDELGTVPGPTGNQETLYLERIVQKDGEQRWVFSRSTVERIDIWYDALPGRWALDYLPEFMLLPGPFELLWWQWLALLLLVPISAFIGKGLSWVTRNLMARLVSQTEVKWDDAILERAGGPLNLAWTLASVYFFSFWLELYEPAQEFLNSVLRTFLFVAFFWSLLRVVDIFRQVIMTSSWAQGYPASRSLIPLGARVVKALVVVMAIVAILTEFGYNANTLLAVGSIGTLAFALAAQKTVENLFGAFSIGVDQPFREGDFVKIGDFLGTVEAIGLRSTRIRTLDRTVITLPNGKLADMNIESFAMRDRIRFHCVIGLEYGTTVAQMNQVIEELEKVLRAHPKTWQESVTVRFSEFAASSLNITVVTWMMTSSGEEFQKIRQELYLQFMEVVEKAGASFAFPTQTIHIAKDSESKA